MTIGARLKEERERLGFTQPAFAGLSETTKKSQIDYEKDLTQPKAGYLAVIAKVGADVQYIVTGVRSNSALAADEQMLVDGYRALDSATRRRTLAFVLTETGPVSVSKKIKEKASESPQHQVVIADGIGTQAAGRKIINKGKNG